MKVKRYNKYFGAYDYISSEPIKFETYLSCGGKKDKEARFCVKVGLDSKLPLQILTMITKFIEQEEELWPNTISIRLSKGRDESTNYCIFAFADLELATEICRFLDTADNGLFKFEVDKYNFPVQYKDTDKTYFYSISESKKYEHRNDIKEFSATLGVYKFLRVVDTIMSSAYTLERFESKTMEALYAIHDLTFDVVEVFDKSEDGRIGFETNFSVKSDLLRDKIVRILEK